MRTLQRESGVSAIGLQCGNSYLPPPFVTGEDCDRPFTSGAAPHFTAGRGLPQRNAGPGGSIKCGISIEPTVFPGITDGS